MVFEEYVELIIASVAECGYDRFMPSLCIVSDTIDLQVLEISPQPNGEKESASEWASEFTSPDRILFCAYRNGDRQVEVVEIAGNDVTNKSCIEVRSHGEQDDL